MIRITDRHCVENLSRQRGSDASCRIRCLENVAGPRNERSGVGQHRGRTEERAHGRNGERGEKLRAADCRPYPQPTQECGDGRGRTQTERISVTHSNLLVFSFGLPRKIHASSSSEDKIRSPYPRNDSFAKRTCATDWSRLVTRAKISSKPGSAARHTSIELGELGTSACYRS